MKWKGNLKAKRRSTKRLASVCVKWKGRLEARGGVSSA